LYNAAVAQGVNAKEITKHFDSVSVCFSKGLGAPVGSMLLGSEALIAKARRWRKVMGGGWRQAGLLAAMANFALDNNVERLSDDHRRAAELANALGNISGIEVSGAFTSMVFITVQTDRLTALAQHMNAHGIKLSTSNSRIRLVMHLDIDDEGLARIIEAFRIF